MKTYPFSTDPKENVFPKKSHIYKQGNNSIEYDIDVLKEYFPELREEKEEFIRAFMHKINQAIVQIH